MLVALLLLAACGADPTTSATAPSTSATDPTTSTPAPSTSGADRVPAGRVIAVSFARGRVSGVGSRVSARLGEQLLLRVTSDVADEVHVHGYGRTATVESGGTVEIAFTADVPGGFEVELEGLGRQLFQLRVA